MASSSTAIVTADTASVTEESYALPAYMGCLQSVGRERLLARYDDQDVFGSVTDGSDFVTAGTFAAFVEDADGPHYGASSVTVRLFDLNTGRESHTVGGEQVGCPGMSICGAQEDRLVINADGSTAAHTTVVEFNGTGPDEQVTEQIVASDSTGLHVEDTATSTHSYETPAPSLLTNLQLTGNTLTWEHNSSPRGAQLS
jgi:hypothetical protein